MHTSTLTNSGLRRLILKVIANHSLVVESRSLMAVLTQLIGWLPA
jgi:hypothetical protein